ncbi:MAG: response regulator [Mariprofundales bacterium]|nr:response regulator [Mariprofundales bacterium]
MILEVDDNDAIREMVDAVLSLEGYRVVTAVDGTQAIAEIKRRLAVGEGLPQLVLLDLTMPKMGGYQTMAELRQLPGGDGVPVIFVSALPEDEERGSALAAGGVDYLSKPFKIPALLAMVARHVVVREG